VIVLEVLGFAAMLCLAYLVGAIPFGLIVGKVFYGVDVRQHGSGNVGSTNVFRVLGKRAGVAVMALDILKGYVPAALAAALFHPWYAIFIAAAPVVGHIYSVFLKGSGGKGVATGAGVVLALVPLAFVICFINWITLIIVTRYVSVASLTVACLVPVLVILLDVPLPYQIAGVLVAMIVWWAHRGNIRRLLDGTESRVTLPWSGKGSTVPGSGGGS
jgi:glycerol-3-phosphate acyltransferase PlsY